MLFSVKAFCQDSLAIKFANKMYSSFVQTQVMAISPAGQFIITNCGNSYGKHESKVYNTSSHTDRAVPNGYKYHFLSENQVLIQSIGETSFLNLTNNKKIIIKGNPEVKILQNKTDVLLFDRTEKKLSCYTNQGHLQWELIHIERFELDGEEKHIICYGEGKLTRMNVDNEHSKTIPVREEIIWLKTIGPHVFTYNQTDSGGILRKWNHDLTLVNEVRISCPEKLRLAERPGDYIEIREGRFLFLPLTRASSSKTKKKEKVMVSYTTRSSAYDSSPLMLGIYDISANTWKWLPQEEHHAPAQVFLNNRGDFIMYDYAADSVENSSNPLVQMTLVLKYGAQKYKLGALRKAKENYYWDAPSGNFIFFKDAEWWCFHTPTGNIRSLLNIQDHSWNTEDYSGLLDTPTDPLVSTNEKSKLIISSTYDLFLVDLAKHTVSRLTDGKKKHIRYRVITSDKDSKSLWNLRSATVDLKKEIILKMFSTRDYNSGIATINNGHVKTIVYDEDRYREVVITAKSKFALSQSYVNPFKVTELKNNRPKIVLDGGALANQNRNDQLHKELLHYDTGSGMRNAVLLYPKNFDPQKKYPMVVDVYTNKSLESLYYSIPDLRADSGFNFMHYVHQGYFVLLPDLEYEIGNISSSLIGSLEAAVKSALVIANIDKENVAVTGFSFGGYEAALALSNTTLFKTGTVGVMVSDLASMALSNSSFIREPNYERVENELFRMGNGVFNNWTNYLQQSPLFHLPKMNKPVLLWTGLKDENVPTAQTKEYFLGMKRLSKRAVLLEFKDEGHTMNTLENKEDLSVRTWQWMEYFLKNKPPAEWIVPIINKAP